jgi:lactobin A/cerein 7B family class IIb bacteriocin
MKKISLKNFNQTLGKTELRDVQGGIAPIVVAYIGMGCLVFAGAMCIYGAHM